MRWVEEYERAWRSADVLGVPRLFTQDARYRPSPYAEPEIGHAAIQAFWRDDEGMAFTVAAEPVAVEGRNAVVRLEVRYGEPVTQEYRDLWVLRFAADGRVEEFEEWAYWPGKAYPAAADAGAELDRPPSGDTTTGRYGPAMSNFPLPRPEDEVVVVPAPGRGPGHWVGAPSAAQDGSGGWVIAYRLRTPSTRGAAVVVAASADGEHLTPVATLRQDRFGAESLERPALVRLPDGRWRLYVSCATPGSKHWRIDVIEAAEPAGLAEAQPTTVLPGDDLLAVKDPVIQRSADGWQAWICCHPLDVPGAEDRMHTRFATSPDGLTWSWRGLAISGRPGAWDARGARITAVLPDGRAAYDGRATAEENFSERTGVALPSRGAQLLAAAGDAPVADVRYLDVVPLDEGGYRLYFEAPLEDGSHELRTAVVPPSA